MYAYCGDNPVMRREDGGHFWWVAALIGGAVNAVASIANQLHSNGGNWNEISIGKVAVSFACGAIAGANIVNPAAAVVVGAVAGAVDSIANNYDRDDMSTGEKVLDALVGAGVGALTSLAGSSVSAQAVKDARISIKTAKSVSSATVGVTRNALAKKAAEKGSKYLFKAGLITFGESVFYTGITNGTKLFFGAYHKYTNS
jgi:hypothetical protein